MSGRKRRAAKVVVPALAAIAVGAVAYAGVAANSSSDSNRSSTAKSADEQRSSATHEEDPDDPATWRLPIEEYLPTESQNRMVSDTRDSLIDGCMKNAGYEQWEPAPDLPELGGKTLTDWRYGIHDAKHAAQRGYHPAADEQEAYDQAMSAGAVDESGADEGALRKCVESADGTVPAAQRSGLVQQISGDAFVNSAKDPQVVDVFAKWSSCMKGKGYTYSKPMDANDDPRFTDPYKVTELEIATATADVECRDKFQVEKVWFDVESKLQEAGIKGNREALGKVKAHNEAAVAEASAAASAR